MSQCSSDQRLELRLGAEIVETGVDHVHLRLVECFLRREDIHDRRGAEPVAFLLYPKVFRRSSYAGLGNLYPRAGSVQLGESGRQLGPYRQTGIGGICLRQIKVGLALYDRQLAIETVEEVPAKRQAE